MAIDLKQLRTFLRVAEAGSLSRASDRLRLAQPALSRQVRMLEAEIGLTLFTRHGRGMRLTEAGQELLLRVADLLPRIEQAIEDVKSLAASASGLVALGMTPTLSHTVAARLMRCVASELPNVGLRIVEGGGGHLMEWLQRGEIDAGLLYGPGADLHLRFVELLFEELMLVGPPSSDFEPGAVLPVTRLGDRELILPSRPNGLRVLVDAAAAKAKVDLSVRFEVDSFRVMKELVETGHGFTVLPASTVQREAETGALRTARLVRPRVTRQIILGLPPDRTETRATRAVIAILFREVGQMVRGGDWKAVPGDGLKAGAARDPLAGSP